MPELFHLHHSAKGHVRVQTGQCPVGVLEGRMLFITSSACIFTLLFDASVPPPLALPACVALTEGALGMALFLQLRLELILSLLQPLDGILLPLLRTVQAVKLLLNTIYFCRHLGRQALATTAEIPVHFLHFIIHQ